MIKRLFVLFATVVLITMFVSEHNVLARGQLQNSEPKILALPHMAWNHSGDAIAIPVGNNVEVRLADSTQLKFVLQDHTGKVLSIAWSLDDKMIATGSGDKSVKLWNSADGGLIRTLVGQNDYVLYVGWSQDSKHIFSSGVNVHPTFLVWNVATGNIEQSHNLATVYDGTFSPNGQYFAVVASENLVMFDGITFERKAHYRETICCNPMWKVAWSPDGTSLVTGSSNGLVTVWNPTNGSMINQFEINEFAHPDKIELSDVPLSWVRDVAFSDDGTSVSGIAGDGTLKRWDIVSGKVLEETRLGTLSTAKFSPFGERVAVLDMSILSAINATPAANPSMNKAFSIKVPNSTFEHLESLTKICTQHGKSDDLRVRKLAANKIDREKLFAFELQVKALPTGLIPEACKADLLALIDALKAQ